LIDWSTIYVVSVLISDEIIIMQRLGACNFLKCSSNTLGLIPINYVMGFNVYSPSKQKHMDVMKMTNF